MKRVWIGVALLGALACGAAENQAYFAIEAETSAQKMAGMPAMPAMPGLPPGFQLPPGVTLPPEAAAALAAMGGGPAAAKRGLQIRLWSPGLAPEGATAWVTPPAGLKLGDRLDLSLYRPKAGETGDEMPPGMQFDPAKITLKLYWGSSATVRRGQPKVIHLGDLSAEQRREMREAQAKARASYFYKPDWTTGYWPGKQPQTIAPDASLVGPLALSSSYTGNVSLDIPAEVDFLKGYELRSPDMSGKPDLSQALALQWAAVPGLLGQNAMGMGMEGRDTFVLWSSSEVESFPAGAGFLEMAQVRELVAARRFMSPETTEVTVPAGIFAKCSMPMVTLTGWGRGTAKDGTQPLPRVQTKTTLQLMLGAPAGGPRGFGGPPPGVE